MYTPPISQDIRKSIACVIYRQIRIDVQMKPVHRKHTCILSQSHALFMYMERISIMCNLADSSHTTERSELPCIRAGRACQCERIDVSYLNNGRVQVPQAGCALFTCIRFPCCSVLCFFISGERLMLKLSTRYQMIDNCMSYPTVYHMCCSDHM